MFNVKIEKKKSHMNYMYTPLPIYVSLIFLLIFYVNMIFQTYTFSNDINFEPEHKMLTLRVPPVKNISHKIKLFHLGSRNIFSAIKTIPHKNMSKSNQITLTPILRNHNNENIQVFRQIHVTKNIDVSFNSISELNEIENAHIYFDINYTGIINKTSIDVIFTTFGEQTFYDITSFHTVIRSALLVLVLIFFMQFYFAQKNFESVFAFLSICVVCFILPVFSFIKYPIQNGILLAIIGFSYRHFLIIASLSSKTKKYKTIITVSMFCAFAIPKIIIDSYINYNYYDFVFPLPKKVIGANLISLCVVIAHVTISIVFIMLEILMKKSTKRAVLIAEFAVAFISIDFEIQIHVVRLIGYIEQSGIRFPYHSILCNISIIFSVVIQGLIITSPIGLNTRTNKNDTEVILSDIDHEIR